MAVVPVTPKAASFYEAVRPFALLAVAAFVLGFLGYVALGAGAFPQPRSDASVAAEPAVAGPASDDWNLPKHI